MNVGPLVLASANQDKATEIRDVLASVVGGSLVTAPITVGDETIGFVIAALERIDAVLAGLPTLDSAPDVEETASTLEGNALIKAQGVGTALGLGTIADDTGLEVDALQGAPGVYSARFAGPDASYADNVAKLLAELDGARQRRARFVTVALAWWPTGERLLARGEVEGRIATSPRGTGGFGYDPVFEPLEGDGSTFAEMSAEAKNRISHRGRAFRALAEKLARAR